MSIDTIITIVFVIYSIILHEVAHGYVAYLCGDDTAKRAGRLSLNPVSHIDPVGSVMVPAIGVMSGYGAFGWAKGVPINLYILSSQLKRFLVSAAGIVTNLIIATIFLLLVKISITNFDQSILQNISDILKSYSELFVRVAIINIGLGFFNLLPIPPFDGMNILRSIFPRLVPQHTVFENNPAFMIGAVLVAGYLFSFIYSDIIVFVFNIFGIR